MIGETIGNYQLRSLLGAGGMGEVFLAEQTAIGTPVAIKVLQTQISRDADQVQRFFNEARAVSRVRHAGTVKIFDCGFHQGHAYLVMEFLEGESLAARIKRLGALPSEQVLDLGRQTAGVLDAVHHAGVTHRDLKPDNIFLVPDQELASGERVKVLDFGIAKLGGTLGGHSPQTQGTMGTPAYMAPEQWNNAADVDGRADAYSLGCVLFEMAAGHTPFPARSIGEACTHHLHTPPPRLAQLVPHVPPQLDVLVDRMLAKDPAQRPALKDIARAFDELRSSASWTTPPPPPGIAVTLPAGSGTTQPTAPPITTPPPTAPPITTPRPTAPPITAPPPIAPPITTPPPITAPPPIAPPITTPPPSPYPLEPPSSTVPPRRKLPLVLALAGVAALAIVAAIGITRDDPPREPVAIARVDAAPNAPPIDGSVIDGSVIVIDASVIVDVDAAALEVDAATRELDAGVMPVDATAPPQRPPKRPPPSAALTPAQVRRTIQGELPRIRACYERMLQAQPDLVAKVTVEMTIDPSGTVSAISADSDRPRLGMCIQRRMRGLRFPASSKPTTIKYPFVFQPDRRP